jgi:Fe-S cluster assembly scaffold IscU
LNLLFDQAPFQLPIAMFKRVVAAVPAQASKVLSTASRPNIAPRFHAAAPVTVSVNGRRNYHEKDKCIFPLNASLRLSADGLGDNSADPESLIRLFSCADFEPQANVLLLLDHYNKPRNVGSMSKNDADVGTGLVGAPACGDVMKLQIRVDPNDNTISDVKFKTFGCGSAIASSSYLTELVRGMTLEEAARVKNTQIAKELCLPPVKCE